MSESKIKNNHSTKKKKVKETPEKLELINRAKIEIKFHQDLVDRKEKLENMILNNTGDRESIDRELESIDYKIQLQLDNTRIETKTETNTNTNTNTEIETNTNTNTEIDQHFHTISFHSRNALIFEYKHYVDAIIDKYYTKSQSRETLEDLKSLTVEIVTAAVRTYDPYRGTKLTTHMYMHIIGKCNRFLEYNTTSVKISSSFYNLKLKVSKLRENPNITETEIMSTLNITRQQYIEIMNVTNTTSLDCEYSDGGNIILLSTDNNPLDELENREMLNSLQLAIDTLSPADRQVVSDFMDRKRNTLPPQLAGALKQQLLQQDYNSQNSAEERFTDRLSDKI